MQATYLRSTFSFSPFLFRSEVPPLTHVRGEINPMIIMTSSLSLSISLSLSLSLLVIKKQKQLFIKCRLSLMCCLPSGRWWRRKKKQNAGDVDVIVRLRRCWLRSETHYHMSEEMELKYWRSADLCGLCDRLTDGGAFLYLLLLLLHFCSFSSPPCLAPAVVILLLGCWWFTALTHRSSTWQSRLTTGLVATHFCLSKSAHHPPERNLTAAVWSQICFPL